MPYAHNGPVDLYYEVLGEPADPALLMINGLGSQCINFRTEMCERFVARGMRVIRFDNRDVGLSTKCDRAGDGSDQRMASTMTEARRGGEIDAAYRLADMAADAVAILDELGIGQAHVIGASMGGMIAQQLAIDRPGRLLSMTSVMSTTGDPDVGQPTPEALSFLTASPPRDRAEAILRHQQGIRIYGSPAHYDPDRLATIAGEAYDRCFYPAGVARQMMAIVSSGSRSDALAAVDLPALVIHGDADKLVDISGGRRTAECIAGARFEVIEGMGHDYPPAYWDRWAELVAGLAATFPGA